MPSSKAIRVDLAITAVLLLLLFSLYANLEACVQQVVPSLIDPKFFPSVVLIALLVVNALVLCLGVFDWRRQKAACAAADADVVPDKKPIKTGESESKASGSIFALLLYIGILFLYVLGLHYLGFVYATPLVMLLISLMLGLRRIVLGCAAYIMFTLLVDYLALHVMQIILPTGALFG